MCIRDRYQRRVHGDRYLILLSESEMDGLEALERAEECQVLYKCPHCEQKTYGFISKEASCFTYVVSIMSVLMFGFFSLLILPILIEASKTSVKRCTECMEVTEQKELFSLPSLRDEVLSFKFGSCVIVISRKYAIFGIGILATAYFVYSAMYPAPVKQISTQLISPGEMKWENYVQDCGRQIYLGNGFKAKQNFEMNYKGKVVTWQGVYMDFKEAANVQSGWGEKIKLLFLKMIPTDSPEFPDIALQIPWQLYDKHQAEIKTSSVGDLWEFTAEIQRLGGEFSFHELIAIDMKKLNTCLLYTSPSPRDS
eukprot:TRINITY_DN9478_c0_g1_i6.p2 TRINITY_DN9478_c0_g1~~TRINITY_DN9478_c0_g1_i6.p2  ORF type:complete len:310 (+),score=42.75 TRINITY_DN9478_c0_g1_i6:67-996(+)